MLDLQLYPAYQDPQMMDYSFYDDQVSCWNPLTMFSQKTNHQVLEQPLFDTAMTPEEIMKDFTL
jgi:hypothetical protein